MFLIFYQIKPDQGLQYYFVIAIAALSGTIVYLYKEISKERSARIKKEAETSQTYSTLLEKTLTFFQAFEKQMIEIEKESNKEILSKLEELKQDFIRELERNK